MPYLVWSQGLLLFPRSKIIFEGENISSVTDLQLNTNMAAAGHATYALKSGRIAGITAYILEDPTLKENAQSILKVLLSFTTVNSVPNIFAIPCKFKFGLGYNKFRSTQ
jgi:hypothetical protein